MDDELKEILVQILGLEAYKLGDMVVPGRVSKLVKCVDYMIRQLTMIDKRIKNEELSLDVKYIIQSVKTVLKEDDE